jgi:flagellar assembly protein FliH
MNAVKFTFDTVFADDNDVVSDEARARKRQTLTQAEIETLRAEAHGEGLKAGEVRALEEVAAGAADAAGAIREALTRATNEIEGLRAQSAGIALAAARTLGRAALAAFPAEEVERCLRDAMHQAIGEPRIVLKASPKVAEALKEKVKEIAHEEGFDGRVQISGDPALANADCRIEWRGGGAERAEAALEAALESLIQRRFSDADPVQLTED